MRRFETPEMILSAALAAREENRFVSYFHTAENGCYEAAKVKHVDSEAQIITFDLSALGLPDAVLCVSRIGYLEA